MNTVDDLLVRPLAGALAAEVLGLDLSAPLSDEVVGAVRAAFLRHQVLCIRGQGHITPDEQLAFGARWGDVSVHPYVPSIEGYPGVMKIYDPNPVTQTWHADSTHMASPPALTMLLARVLPAVGGDTMFASATRAFAALSPALQQTLLGLRAVHQGTELAAAAGLDRGAVTASHPVIRTHPETGERAIFVNDNYVSHIDGWTKAESAPLLDFLYAAVPKPEFTYRHRWQDGDMLIWDNRCTQHAVVGDTAGAERILHRVTIAGDIPV
jgi:taurine dioxygenase